MALIIAEIIAPSNLMKTAPISCHLQFPFHFHLHFVHQRIFPLFGLLLSAVCCLLSAVRCPLSALCCLCCCCCCSGRCLWLVCRLCGHICRRIVTGRAELICCPAATVVYAKIQTEVVKNEYIYYLQIVHTHADAHAHALCLCLCACT